MQEPRNPTDRRTDAEAPAIEDAGMGGTDIDPGDDAQDDDDPTDLLYELRYDK